MLATCGVPQSGPAERTITVQRDNIDASIATTGTVTPAAQARLNFRVNGVLSQYSVPVGARVTAGQELATLDAPELDAAVAVAEANLSDARAALKAARAKLDLMQTGPRAESVAQARADLMAAQARLAARLRQGRVEEVASRQAALDAANAKLEAMQRGGRSEDIAQAQAALDQARAKLQALQNGPRPEQVAIYRTQVEQARNALLAAQLNRDAICGMGKGGPCDAANAQVYAAQNGVDLANQQMRLNTAPPTASDLMQAQAAVTSAAQALERAKVPYTAEDIQQQRDAVIQAQKAVDLASRPNTQPDIDEAAAAVESAEAALGIAQSPFVPQEIEQAEAAVQQAEAGVQLREAQLRTAKLNQGYRSLRAPFDGVVLSEPGNPGEAVGPGGVLAEPAAANAPGNPVPSAEPVLLLASDRGVQINANIDQIDIDRVKVGQRVEVTLDAFPNRKFTGKVTFVPAQGTAVQNVQQYVVYIGLDDDARILKPGMTASCAIVVDSKSDALTVPTAAIQNVAGRPAVLLKAPDGGVREQPVETGLANATTTEVVSGLQLGDMVVLGRITPPPAPGGSGTGR